MLSRFEFYSNLNQMLRELRDLNWDVGVEQASKAGDLLRKTTRRELVSNKTHYVTTYVKSKKTGKTYKKIERTATAHNFGKIVDPTGRFKVNLENLIQYVSYPKTGTMVFMGVQKRGSVIIPKNGKMEKHTWDSIREDSIFIFKKLNYGKIGNAKWRNSSGGKSSEPMKRFENAKYPATKFVDNARSQSMPTIRRLVMQGHSEALRQRGQKIQTPMRRVG